MKKIIVVLLLACMLVSMTGCSLAVELIANAGLGLLNSAAPDYGQPDLEFSFAEISFVLTDAFSEVVNVDDEYANYMSYAATTLTVERHAHSTGMMRTAAEYAEIYREFLDTSLSESGIYEYSFSESVTDGEVVYFDITLNALGTTSYEFISIYANGDASYVFSFVVDPEKYEAYKPYLIKWATSVKTTSSTSQI